MSFGLIFAVISMASNSDGMQSSVVFEQFISYFRGFKSSTNGSHANHRLRAPSLDDNFAWNRLTLQRLTICFLRTRVLVQLLFSSRTRVLVLLFFSSTTSSFSMQQFVSFCMSGLS